MGRDAQTLNRMAHGLGEAVGRYYSGNLPPLHALFLRELLPDDMADASPHDLQVAAAATGFNIAQIMFDAAVQAKVRALRLAVHVEIYPCLAPLALGGGYTYRYVAIANSESWSALDKLNELGEYLAERVTEALVTSGRGREPIVAGLPLVNILTGLN